MTAGSSFTNAFGGVAIRPAQPSYLAITIGHTTALVWPLETTEGQPVVATQIDVTAALNSLQLQMPPGDTGSTGVQTIISNVGSDTFTVADQAGNPITPIATTETWLIALIDNTTENGTWRAIQIGATVSEATAAALAGFGLQVSGSRLQVNWPTRTISTSGTVTGLDRSSLLDWTGSATGTLQLASSASMGLGFICAFDNTGTGVVTFTCTGGDTINGVASLDVHPGTSGFLICKSGGFLSIGALTGVLPITGGGTGATTANDALENFGGSTTGIAIFTAPSTAAVVALLGLTTVNISEVTVATNQSLNTSSGNTAFVCQAAINLSLPLTTSLTNHFSFLAFAQDGDVTLIPQATDAIQGQSVGANLVIPSGASAFVFTDANGNWWMFFFGLPLSGGTLTGGLTIEAGGLSVIAGGAGINGGLAVNQGLDVNGGIEVMSGGILVDSGAVTVTEPGTTGDQVVNFSQFAATLSVPGSQALPSGLVEQWGTGSTSSGVGTISFAVPFDTACLNVDFQIFGVATGSVHPLLLGTVTAAGAAVFGDASESLSFSYRALGH